jgi:hypothetical protein
VGGDARRYIWRVQLVNGEREEREDMGNKDEMKKEGG